MKIHPYLNFAGKTEEAFRFYEKALGGKLSEIHRFGSMPQQEGFELTPEQKALVLHVGLRVQDVGHDLPCERRRVRSGGDLQRQQRALPVGREVDRGLPRRARRLRSRRELQRRQQHLPGGPEGLGRQRVPRVGG